MAEKKNYYAVKVGRRPGIYRTWDECKKNVHGYKGAIFKGFVTQEEAERFMGDVQAVSASVGTEALQDTADVFGNSVEQSKSAMSDDSIRWADPGESDNKLKPAKQENAEAVAYVDGSFNIITGEYSYGMVLYHDGNVIEKAEKFDDAEMALMRNVAGEIEGSMHAMAYCIENGIKSIDIYYDYEGIEKWALGMWKTNKNGTREYKKYYDSVKDKIHVHFHKVKGHSGDPGNDRADRLAKSALGITS